MARGTIPGGQPRWEISPLFTWLATRFTGGTDLEGELLATGVSGDLAYTVAYERSIVSVHDEPLQPNTLRVTQVYRREDGDWKLIHRHGDGPLSTRDRPARHHVDVTVIGLQRVRCADIVARRRRVENHYLLKRITSGLGIPPEFMGLSWWGPDGAYCGVVPVAELPEGVSAEMFRRHLLVLGATAAFGNPIKGLGELHGQVAIPASESMPSRLSGVHVVQVRELTSDLRTALLDHGSNPTMSNAAAAWADRLLALPGPEKLTRELKTAVAELHVFAAGWAALDAGIYDRALYSYFRALELATEIGNAYLQAIATACAGLTMLEHAHPGEGLKMLQFAQVTAWKIPPGYDRGIVESCAMADSAIAYACLGDARTAAATVVKSRQLWTPNRSDPRGDH